MKYFITTFTSILICKTLTASPILLNKSFEMQRLLDGIPQNVKYFWSSTNDTWDKFLSYDVRKCMDKPNISTEKEYKKSFYFCGLRRSGNHVISSWILSMLRGKVSYFNNMRLGADPFELASTTSNPQLAEIARNDRDVDSILISFEDYLLADILNLDLPYKEQRVGRIEEERTVIALRDPFNMMSSRSKKFFNGTKSIASPMDIWLEYAKICAGELESTKQVTCILFNKFLVDKNYREDVAGDLGLEFKDFNKSLIPQFGKGTSFGDTKVKDRLLHLRENKFLCSELLQPEHFRMAEHFFPDESQVAKEICED